MWCGKAERKMSKDSDTSVAFLRLDARRVLKLAVRAGFEIKMDHLASSGAPYGRRSRDDTDIDGISGSGPCGHRRGRCVFADY